MKRNITGMMFYYYFVCHRKLWYFTHELTFEDGNEDVAIGRLIDENSYSKNSKHIMIDNTINVDFIKEWKILHEIKKQKSIEEAAEWQVKYYLYFLKKRGIMVEKGILVYPKLRERKEIFLLDKDIERIEHILKNIEKIIKNESPPELKKLKICKKCAYYEYCYI